MDDDNDGDGLRPLLAETSFQSAVPNKSSKHSSKDLTKYDRDNQQKYSSSTSSSKSYKPASISNIQKSNKRYLHLVIILLLVQSIFLAKFNTSNIYSLFVVKTSEITPVLSETRKYPVPKHSQLNIHKYIASQQENNILEDLKKPTKYTEKEKKKSTHKNTQTTTTLKNQQTTTKHVKKPDLTQNSDSNTATKETLSFTLPVPDSNVDTTPGSQPEVVADDDRNFHYPSVPRPELPKCPVTPPRLVGALAVSYEKPYDYYNIEFPNSKDFPPSFDDLIAKFPHFNEHSIYSPANYTDSPCNPPFEGGNVAIIICYRNREVQLRFFLLYMLPILIRQQLRFKIYIIEQVQKTTFNRAKLFNAGYDIAKNDPSGIKWDCYTFHDVDLILENDNMLYRCDNNHNPRHLSVGVSTFNYKLPYAAIFGGITQIPSAKFEHINGYSNKYWGWGGEDDDMYRRVFQYGKYSLVRPDINLARFKMITHVHESSNTANPDRFKLLRTWRERMDQDGLRSLKYTVISRSFSGIFEKIIVDIGDKPKVGKQ